MLVAQFDSNNNYIPGTLCSQFPWGQNYRDISYMEGWRIVGDNFTIPIDSEKIKHQAKVDLDAQYSIIYEGLSKAFAAAMQSGNPTEPISAMRMIIIEQHRAAKEAIDNG